ncbi:MAG: acyl-CoA thioesterase [bacterium]|nr:acyl-CoA thioesterase [bacterium]
MEGIIDFLNSKVVVIREYVRYYEVDKMEVVHHSNYYRYYELARCFYFSKNILPYSVLENDYKIYSPLLESSSKYIKKLEFEDIFYISCFIDEIDLNKIYFRYFTIKDIDIKELNDFFSFIGNNKSLLAKNPWYYNYLKVNYKTLILQNIISEGITVHTFVNKDFKPINLKSIYIKEKENNIYQLLLNLKI